MRRNWTRDELILAANLYFKLTFGEITHKNPKIQQLAELINRTPSAVALKLSNFASFDPSLQERGIKGMQNAGKLDRIIWDEFYNNLDDLSYESEKQLAELKGQNLENILEETEQENYVGEVKERLVKTRVQQSFFRQSVLASYDFKCCMTGIGNADLLIASHIKPWAADIHNRLNPMNGLCLNALHDRAFDKGLITVTADYKIKVSDILLDSKDKESKRYFSDFKGRNIILPKKFLPDRELLAYHNEVIFRS
jgi:putative restriction endonuclease